MSNVKMKPEIKQRWVDALRSENYKQCYFALKEEDRFCVIGVLCDVLKNDINGFWDENDCFICQDEYFECEEIVYYHPPNKLFLYCGVEPSEQNRYYFQLVKYGDNSECRLINLNDIDRLTFNQLADLIEEQL